MAASVDAVDDLCVDAVGAQRVRRGVREELVVVDHRDPRA